MKLTRRALFRRQAGFTQHRLAKLTGISVPRISLWENGEIEIRREEVRQIAIWLGRAFAQMHIRPTATELAEVLVRGEARVCRD